MECLLPYLCMVNVPHIMVGLERMLDYRGVGLARFHYSVDGSTLITRSFDASSCYINAYSAVINRPVTGKNGPSNFGPVGPKLRRVI